MNTGLYAACAGLMAQNRALDNAANNLANVNTTGYKGELTSFASVLAASNSDVSSAVQRAVSQFGVIGAARADLSQGSLTSTGNDLDFAVQGSGYFAVQTDNGRMLTRNGHFHVDRSGHLVTSDGSAVMGPQGAIMVPPGKVTVSADGTISVDGALSGQLQVVDTAPDQPVSHVGGSYYSAPGQESTGAGKVVQGSLESSNVNPVEAAVGLVAVQRRAEMLMRALTIFHSDMNRIAAQDLPRI